MTRERDDPPLRPPRALLLDLDGTLLDDGWHRVAITRACREIAGALPGLDADRLAEANAGAWDDYWPRIEHRWMLGRLSGADVRREVWRRTLRTCGFEDGSLALRAAETFYGLCRDAYRLYDDVEGLVAAARRADISLAVITNGAPDDQREKLRTLGIEDWFGAIVISGEIGVGKPDPAVFRRALQGLGVEAGAAWHVGDLLGADVAGANAAGVGSVWLNRPGASRGEADPVPDLEVRSLSEVVRRLAVERLIHREVEDPPDPATSSGQPDEAHDPGV